jgi:hypothetical protein
MLRKIVFKVCQSTSRYKRNWRGKAVESWWVWDGLIEVSRQFCLLVLRFCSLAIFLHSKFSSRFTTRFYKRSHHRHHSRSFPSIMQLKPKWIKRCRLLALPIYPRFHVPKIIQRVIENEIKVTTDNIST